MRPFLFLPLLISVFPSLVLSFGFNDKIYQDIKHYANFAKLSACISKHRIVEGLLYSEGGCDIKFCQKARNSAARVFKLRNAPEDENGTGFITLDKKNEEIIVAFRGSTTRGDWIGDLQFFMTDYKPLSPINDDSIPQCHGCKVHTGFYKNLESIKSDILDPVEDLFKEYPHYKLVVVGHSLGGALAALIGIEFRVRGYHPSIITFAGPKLFNPLMANWVNDIFKSDFVSQQIIKGGNFDAGYLRVVHDEDFVPMLPPKYRQAGVEFFITKKHLPHNREDVDFRGVQYIQMNSNTTQNALDMLHAYEHRTYFMTINKCDDIDPIFDEI